MTIGLSYPASAIQPGIVYLPGIVIIAAGPTIDAAETVTPGITVTRQGTGLYTMTFNDGATVGFVQCSFTSVHVAVGANALGIALLNATNSKAGSTAISLEISSTGGTFIDPLAGDGFCYLMTRINTTVEIT